MSSESSSKTLVAEIIDNETLVLNRGSRDGLKVGQRYLVYSLGNDIVDPETNEVLGKLEIVKGTGRVLYVQERISTLKSDMTVPQTRLVKKTTNLYTAITLGGSEVEEINPPVTAPFKEVKRGDIARQV